MSYTSLSERVLARFEATPKYGPADPLQTAPYLAAQAEREAAAYRVEVAKRQAIPDVTVSLGVRRIEADKANAMLVGVSVPLPLFDRNCGNISAALAEKQGAEARATAARRRGCTAIHARWQDLDGTVHEEDMEGLMATCLQHEMDHLEGILFIDHLSRLKRSMVMKKLEKMRRAYA